MLVDGAQMVQHGPVDVAALGADFYAFSGHKVFAPNGIGVLWGRAEALAALPPFLGGGGMIGRVTAEETTYAAPPRRFEAGTPPIAQAVGLGAALDWLRAQPWASIHAHTARLAQRLLEEFAVLPGLTFLDRASCAIACPSLPSTWPASIRTTPASCSTGTVLPCAAATIAPSR